MCDEDVAILAMCEHALYVSRVFGAELKPCFPFFFLYPQFLFPTDNFILSAESVSLPWKYVFSQTIPMPEVGMFQQLTSHPNISERETA